MFNSVSTKKSVLAIALIVSVTLTLLNAQQVDSFYLDVLKKGEQYYIDGDYANAIRKLKIAIFGLNAAKELHAKAYVYLCLSHFYLKDKDNSEKYLKDAERLMGQEELLALDITDAARNDLERLIYTFKAGSNPVNGLRLLPKLPNDKLLSNSNSDQYQLEQRVRDNPRDPSFYYELYNIYRRNYNYSGAKKTIEDLVKNNPHEMYGYYLLGIILYQEVKFKEALDRFENFFKLTGSAIVKEDILTEVFAYQILSNYLKGDRNKVRELITQNATSFTRERIQSIPLSEKDKRMLQGIVDIYLR